MKSNKIQEEGGIQNLIYVLTNFRLKAIFEVIVRFNGKTFRELSLLAWSF